MLPSVLPQAHRLSRRERRRRLYFLGEIMARAQELCRQTGATPPDWPAAFDTDAETFGRWLAETEDVPRWIPQLGAKAYGIPEPRRSILPTPWLWWTVLAVVLAGIAGVLALAR